MSETHTEQRGDFAITVWMLSPREWAYTAHSLSRLENGIVTADNRHEAVDEAYEEIKRKV